MRFFENGPTIAAHLLEQRALGNVIFFCGAGISRRAGLPDFGGLAKKLIESLNADKAAKAFQGKENFDRVFNALIGEFGGQEIDRQIYEALKVPRRPKLDNHKIVLNLSRNAVGLPQIVTTNFDLLFEKADSSLRPFVPPLLPDVSLGSPVQGIVYLHGRLAKPNSESRAGYIISSADFGRAYLAEGWAARFVKALRERYTIVLLGYSANDPPMRYLLEGLHSQVGASHRSPMYAFASGTLGDIEEDWRDRGVTPIAYDAVDQDHSGLWDTLSAWAAASADPLQWNAHVISLAQRRPSELRPFERGQVAQFVSTKAGAKIFADSMPRPSAEWLCVFDQNARYAKPRKKSFEEAAPEIDPLDMFGLDDDPERPPPKLSDQAPSVGTNYLRWMYGDTSFPERTGLAGWNPEWTNQLPERLHHLSRWIGNVAHEPAAVWWAAGWLSLHPGLTWFVNRRLRDGDGLPEKARKFWQLYLEAAAPPLLGDHDFRWYEFKEILKQGGWTNFALREFERAIRPHATFSRSPYGPPHPPVEDWARTRLRDLLEMRVRVLDRHGDDVTIAENRLPAVVELVRRSLETAAQLLDEIETVWWQAPTLYPTGDPGEEFHGRKEQYFLWFAELFDQLKRVEPDAAKSEMDRWDHSEPYFFGKVSLYAVSDPELASGSEAASKLAEMADSVFFDAHNRRELLFALRRQWPNFSSRERRLLEQRIIRGAPRDEDAPAREHRKRTAANAASMLRWLELHGCALTLPTTVRLPKLKAADPRWTDSWALAADDSLGPRGGLVETVKDVQGLDQLPVDKIVAAAEKRTEERLTELRHYRPFEGLIEASPFRALSALRCEAKRSKYPVELWQDLLSSWPERTSLRLRWLMAGTIGTLPQNVALDLRYYAPGWLRTHLKGLASTDRYGALRIFDAALAPFRTASRERTSSSIGSTSIGGVVQDRSEVSYGKAINSPIGKLTECLFSLQGKVFKSRPFPKYLSNRLEVLFNVPGNGGGHAVCIAAQRMGWLDFYHRSYVQQALVPLFSLDSELSEAAWHGRAYDKNGLSNETWKALLPDFLNLLQGRARWKLDEPELRKHVQALVWLSRRSGDNPPLISRSKARSVLVALDDVGRAEILNTLSHIAATEGEWAKFIKPFIEEAWPRQLRYRNEESSRAFARLVESVGRDFPDAVVTVLPFLRPVPHIHMITYRLAKEDPDERDLARSYPAATLSLLNALVPDDPSSMPYELPRVLELIGDADPSLRQTAAWGRLHDLIS